MPPVSSAPAPAGAYHLVLLPAGFSPAAMNANGLIAGDVQRDLPGEYQNIYLQTRPAVYDPLSGTMTRVPDPADGHFLSSARAINVHGDVAGEALYATTAGAFIAYADGRFVLFDPRGPDPLHGAAPVSLTDNGLMVVNGFRADASRGVVHQPAVYDGTNVRWLGAALDFAYAANSKGAVAGCANDLSTAAIFQVDSIQSFLPGDFTHYPCFESINEAGAAVGTVKTPLFWTAFLWDGAAIHTLSATPWAAAHALNASGQIVGEIDAGGDYANAEHSLWAPVKHAAIWDLGRVQDLNGLVDTFGHTLVTARGINDAGMIFGDLEAGSGGYVLIPRR